MSSLLLSIGCDSYDEMENLSAAVKDARSVHGCLMKSTGLYNPKSAYLLESPSYRDVIGAFQSTMKGRAEDIDLVTFYFAGHGVYANGNYFLCVRDTLPQSYATTALSFQQLLVIVMEMQPRHTNIVIDACNAGGLAGGLAGLINTFVDGTDGSPSISLFAAATRDQSAYEEAGGGIATSAMLKLLDGDVVIQSHNPVLNLIEVGLMASKTTSEENVDQTPLVWGLNLLGRGPLSKNPHYASATPSDIPLYAPVEDSQKLKQAIRDRAEELWECCRKYRTDFDATTLLNIICEIVVEDGPVTEFISGLNGTLATHSRESADGLARFDTIAVLCVALLKCEGRGVEYENCVTELLGQAVIEARRYRDELLAAIDIEPLYLINKQAGPADLFYLPLRISRLFGWIGCAMTIEETVEGNAQPSKWIRLLDQIWQLYKESIVSISDMQAGHTYVLLAALRRAGEDDVARTILLRLCVSLIEANGRMLGCVYSREAPLSIIRERAEKQILVATSDLAAPSEMSATIMYWAYELNTTEMDYHLVKLDHKSIIAVFGNDPSEYASRTMENAENLIMRMGLDVWTCEEVAEKIRTQRENMNMPDPAGASQVDMIWGVASILSCYILSNRAPWFMV